MGRKPISQPQPQPQPDNPNTKPSPKVYHIGGIPVEFPYKPYGTQLAFMGRVISTLDRASRDGHCHALLESPTGTGKSLSLLCSALAWQRHRKDNPVSSLSKPDPRALVDPINHGGGFIAEDSQLSETLTPDASPSSTNDKGQKKKVVPTIFYASRTHSQISQVIREYRKTTYRVPMAVLASRKHYCTNASVRKTENIDEECKLLLEDKENGCPHFKNAHKVKCHPSVQKGGCNEAHDIEDLVKVGKTVKGCSYFAARSMADDAHIVFCPYSYIINPVIRRAMEVDIKGAVLILDEAHNIEDMSRDAGSVDVDEDAFQKLQMELGQLCGSDALIYQPLFEMVQGIITWMYNRKDSLEKREFQHYFSCWTGDKALRELQEANISQQCFPILQECAVKAIKAASDSESGMPHLSGMAAITLEGIFCSLSYFFKGNGIHSHDYQLVVQRFMKKPTANTLGGWTLSFSLWCLSPAVIFRDISELSMSVILTSGTLSPMHSFSSELGIPFGTQLEAPHVIDVESQVWASVISTGPRDYPLNASYRTADVFAFQDAVGKSLEELFSVIPGGSLVFFPSYKLMDKLCKRWHETGQWSRLNARKPLYVEPRGGSQEDLETELKGYYSSIRGVNKPTLGKRKKAKKVDPNCCKDTDSQDMCGGAAFLAVCRGKVSEGIDFSDENARAVIIVGIPFPNINDLHVAEKKKYNDMYKLAKNLLSGSEWYCHQAFRALNQAAGRCIRHSSDYGAVIFLDERFREERNMVHISKWLRKSVRTYDNFETSVEELQTFFSKIKARIGNANLLQEPVLDSENIPPDNLVKRYLKQESQKLAKSQVGGMRTILGNMLTARLSHSVGPESSSELQEPSSVHPKDMDSQNEIATNCYSREEFRSRETPGMAVLDHELELSVVQETPIGRNCDIASPEASMIDDNSHCTIIQNSTEFLPVNYTSLTHGQSASVTTCSDITPERKTREHTKGLTMEKESSVNLSVNSHAQKRRAVVNPPGINLMQEMKFDMATTEEIQDNRLMKYSSENGISSQRAKLSESMHFSKCELSLLEHSTAKIGASSLSAGLLLDQRLQISCSLCRNSLGIGENNSYVKCSSISLSKRFLTSLAECKLQPSMQSAPTALPVLVVDNLSVDPRVCNSNNKDIPGQGIWSQEDGCVYNTIFCPFCSPPGHCLGVQIMATNASNFHLIDKVLFYYDRLSFNTARGQEGKDLPINNGSSPTQTININSIDKYAYQSPQTNSGGWRTTKSKAKLQKRSSVSQF
ncbi:uncharacterized protein LOC141611789 isoform X1 [Silene latifolia]|uniref:uncharacterized protein LOC141611789 isoform X1 n=2 Tax=Silene latifolia TaxID=37657 RepID=UPI003D776391